MANWQQVKELLDEALDVPAGERPAYLEPTRETDPDLWREVQALLELEERSGDFLAEPIFSLYGGPAEDPNLGRRVGPFRLLERLPGGGMGAVYLAERVEGAFAQRAAVKLIKRGMDTEEIIRRFEMERQILAQLGHDGIAKLLDGGTTEDGLPFFALEYVEGAPLDQYCRAQGLLLRERITLFLKVCEAVAFAHRNLVVHRDLKPSNILVTPEGVPKLLDFGIANLLTPEGAGIGAVTVAGTVPMTPGYASPEQLAGGALTTATDIYSLGIVLYELLTGRRPFEIDTWSLAAWQALLEDQQPPRPSSAVAALDPANDNPTRATEGPQLQKQLRGDLDKIALKAIAKDPAERYGTVVEFAEDLKLYLAGQPVRARAQTWSYRAGKFVRRNAVGVSVAAAFLLTLAGSAWMTVAQGQRVASAEATTETVRAVSKGMELFLIEDVFRVLTSENAEKITAREILDNGAERVEARTDLPPATKAMFLDVIGRVYRKMGLRKEALPRLERALTLRRALEPSDPLAVAESLNNLALPLREAGEYERAESGLREAMEIQRSALPSGNLDPVVFAATLSNLASFLDYRGRAGEALPLFEEALSIKRKALPPDSPELAKTVNLLAGLYINRGDYAAAGPLLKFVLEVRRAQKGPAAQPELATSLNNLALFHLDQGQLDEAEPLLAEDEGLRQRIYAEQPSKLALGSLSRGLLAVGRGRYQEARSAFEQALAGFEAPASPEPDRAANVKRHLAALFTLRPELGSCEQPAAEARAFFGTKKPGTFNEADAKSVLGGCLASLGRLEEAEPLVREGYEQLKVLTKRRPYLPDAKRRLVDVYRALGQSEKAAAVEAEAAAP